MVEQEYNKKYRKWKNGDTFAVKIKEGEYQGRYLILIRYENLEWEDTKPVSFRVKITSNNKLPKTQHEIEELEYIQTYLEPYRERFYTFCVIISNEDIIKERSKVKFYPDKNGFMKVYLFEILFRRKELEELNNFIYLGNYEFSTPREEYIPFSPYCGVNYDFLTRLETKLITCYKNYNLKQLSYYTEEGQRTWDGWGTDIPPSMEEVRKFCKMMGLNFDDEEETEDSLTYVGGEDEDPFKK